MYLCCDSSITSKRVEHRRYRVAAISLSLTNSVLHVDVGKLDKTVLAIVIVRALVSVQKASHVSGIFSTVAGKRIHKRANARLVLIYKTNAFQVVFAEHFALDRSFVDKVRAVSIPSADLSSVEGPV